MLMLNQPVGLNGFIYPEHLEEQVIVALIFAVSSFPVQIQDQLRGYSKKLSVFVLQNGKIVNAAGNEVKGKSRISSCQLFSCVADEMPKNSILLMPFGAVAKEFQHAQ